MVNYLGEADVVAEELLETDFLEREDFSNSKPIGLVNFVVGG